MPWAIREYVWLAQFLLHTVLSPWEWGVLTWEVLALRARSQHWSVPSHPAVTLVSPQLYPQCPERCLSHSRQSIHVLWNERGQKSGDMNHQRKKGETREERTNKEEEKQLYRPEYQNMALSFYNALLEVLGPPKWQNIAYIVAYSPAFLPSWWRTHGDNIKINGQP